MAIHPLRSSDPFPISFHFERDETHAGNSSILYRIGALALGILFGGAAALSMGVVPGLLIGGFVSMILLGGKSLGSFFLDVLRHNHESNNQRHQPLHQRVNHPPERYDHHPTMGRGALIQPRGGHDLGMRERERSLQRHDHHPPIGGGALIQPRGGHDQRARGGGHPPERHDHRPPMGGGALIQPRGGHDQRARGGGYPPERHDYRPPMGEAALIQPRGGHDQRARGGGHPPERHDHRPPMGEGALIQPRGGHNQRGR